VPHPHRRPARGSPRASFPEWSRRAGPIPPDRPPPCSEAEIRGLEPPWGAQELPSRMRIPHDASRRCSYSLLRSPKVLVALTRPPTSPVVIRRSRKPLRIEVLDPERCAGRASTTNADRSGPGSSPWSML
jgi:hypothetical protein